MCFVVEQTTRVLWRNLCNCILLSKKLCLFYSFINSLATLSFLMLIKVPSKEKQRVRVQIKLHEKALSYS